jgi:hypothetical protein
MTIGIDSQNLESFVPVYDVAPKTWEEGMPFIVEQLKKLANAINAREIGFFLDQELLTGKNFIPGINDASDGGSSQQFRSILRKVIDFSSPGGIAASNSKPHGITFDNNFTLMQLYGSATWPNNFAIPIPYVTASNFIQLYMDTTNVNIVTNGPFTNYTRCFVVIEYIQEL